MSTTSESRRVAAAAIRLALTPNREEESELKQELIAQNIRGTAVDYGGEYSSSIQKVVERAVVAARREQVIQSDHRSEGSVAGATREALSQIMPKALGLNVGGKIGIASDGSHVAVAVFFTVGLLHLDEVAIGLGHRAIS